jgi:YD repeat-containing protein
METGETVEHLASGIFSFDNPHYRLLSFVDPRGGKTTYRYDDAQRTVEVTSPGQTTIHEQDPSGRLMPIFHRWTGGAPKSVANKANVFSGAACGGSPCAAGSSVSGWPEGR